MPIGRSAQHIAASGPRAELQFQLDLHRSHGTARPVFEMHSNGCASTAPMNVTPVLVARRLSQRQPDGGRGGLVGVLDWELAHLGGPDGRPGLVVRQRVALSAASICGGRLRQRAKICS